MTVMCVKPIVTTSEGAENSPRPQVGDKDIVIEERFTDGSLYYLLERFGKYTGFNARNFATLPDEPAELIEESIEEPELQTV